MFFKPSCPIEYVRQLHSRANSLAIEFRQGGGRNHIDEAIALDHEALELCPPGHPMQSFTLTLLSVRLNDRYSQFGEMIDLDDAIEFGRDVLALHPRGHPERSVSLSNLVNYLSTRHDQLGDMKDINEAITLGRDALALRPPGNPDRSISLDNLAVCLSARYDKLGVVEDLNEAISLGRKALALRPPGHPYRSTSLDNLAVYLATRYDQLGTIEDINEAIALGRDALVLLPPVDPDRSRTLDNLGTYLSARYKQLGESEDINEAINFGRDALVLRPPGHPDRSLSLENLAAHLFARYAKLQEIDNLHRAIALGRDALALRPPGHPDRPTSLENLAARLFRRYQKLREIDDLNEAIVVGRSALQLLPLGHPYRSQSLDYLASYLCARFTQLSQLEDKEELFSLYAQIAHMPPTVSSTDLSAVRAWTRAAEDFEHPSALLAYETSLRLLIHHLAALPSLPQHLNVFKSLTSSLAMDAFSACLRNHSPTKAVEFLEQGRGVFWSQLTRLRSPLDDVITSGSAGKTLAEKFTQLTSLIRNALDSPGADQHDHVCRLNVELQGVVADIRELPSLSRFLLPSPFSDLRKAASGGPVIIVNASTYSCDALIVLLDRDPVHIPLQITRNRVQDMSSELHVLTIRAKKVNVTKYLAVILRELWKKVVSPIVDCLERMHHPPQSRIWWCPTAEFCLLPLHAAGSYREGQRKISDLYISSYTPTLAALIHARRYEPMNFSSEGKRFVAIGQSNAAGQSELHSVGVELANVTERIKSLAAFRIIEGPSSCVAQVAEELHNNEWVHFACHGLPNRKQPFESAFALYDGHFTIERIIRCELQHAQFAYLSACHTTVGDEECPDEMIHLASAMQFAGFRSVIGTMWAVDDEQTEKITSMFYDNMVGESGHLDYTRAAFALHKTTQTLTGISFDQRTLYVHLGA